MTKRHNWYNAARKSDAPKDLVPGNYRFVYVRKSDAFVLNGNSYPEAVHVWNGRHFMITLSPEDARRCFDLGSKVAENQQKAYDDNYSFYLNY